jgi:pyruvate/2-oxoacid:ferredoxin oxidoreductase alpha subunit
MENDGMEADTAEASAMSRAEKGGMPGFAAMDATVITATVEEINLERNTFKLKGPDGKVNEYVARNPQNLKLAAVGDLVVITVTEAVAITVESQPAQ